jgi:hypothetical protein
MNNQNLSHFTTLQFLFRSENNIVLTAECSEIMQTVRLNRGLQANSMINKEQSFGTYMYSLKLTSDYDGRKIYKLYVQFIAQKSAIFFLYKAKGLNACSFFSFNHNPAHTYIYYSLLIIVKRVQNNLLFLVSFHLSTCKLYRST